MNVFTHVQQQNSNFTNSIMAYMTVIPSCFFHYLYGYFHKSLNFLHFYLIFLWVLLSAHCVAIICVFLCLVFLKYTLPFFVLLQASAYLQPNFLLTVSPDN